MSNPKVTSEDVLSLYSTKVENNRHMPVLVLDEEGDVFVARMPTPEVNGWRILAEWDAVREYLGDDDDCREEIAEAFARELNEELQHG